MQKISNTEFNLTIEIMDYTFWGLLGYSCAITLIWIVTLGFLIKNIRSVRKRRRYSRVEDKPKDLVHLNRKSIDNKYQIDSLSSKARTLPVIPTKYRRISEYDSTNFLSQPTAEIEGPPVFHHYEEMKTPKNQNRQYERIIEHVVTSLSAVCEGSSKSEDIYSGFMKQLLTNIKKRHPAMYDTILSSGVGTPHMYEEVNEKKQPDQDKKSEKDFEDESSYATYLPPNENKHVDAKKSKNVSNSARGLGSTDHLKFLQESKSVKCENETPYLEAKRFCARDDCPESLRKLCDYQDVFTSTQEAPLSSPDRQIEIISEYKVVSTVTTQSRHSAHFDQKAKKLEKVLSKMLSPELPPKLTRKKSSVISGETLL